MSAVSARLLGKRARLIEPLPSERPTDLKSAPGTSRGSPRQIRGATPLSKDWAHFFTTCATSLRFADPAGQLVARLSAKEARRV